MEVEVSKSPRSPLPFILSGLVIDSRLLHVLQHEHVVPIAPSLDETSTFLCCCLRLGLPRSPCLRMRSGTAGWSRPATSQSGRRWLGSNIAQPGMSDERQKSRLCGRHCISDLAGSKTSDAERLPEARRDVTVLVIPPLSGASRPLLRVLRFQVRLLREACLAQARDVSAVCTIKEPKWKPIRHL